jgi:hypothetical protein
VAAVTFAAWLIAAPFAGMAEAVGAVKKATAADMAAAKRTDLNVIPFLLGRSATAARTRGARVTPFDPLLLSRDP